jgi:hypothetical protein
MPFGVVETVPSTFVMEVIELQCSSDLKINFILLDVYE